MTAAYIGNRHAGLRRFRQYSQLLLDRITSPTLNTDKDSDSIHHARRSGTPSLLLCIYVRSKKGLLHDASNVSWSIDFVADGLSDGLTLRFLIAAFVPRRL